MIEYLLFKAKECDILRLARYLKIDTENKTIYSVIMEIRKNA